MAAPFVDTAKITVRSGNGGNGAVGAGAVVTHDLPSNVVAVGSPCRILRELDERDRAYYFKDKKIDWTQLS